MRSNLLVVKCPRLTSLFAGALCLLVVIALCSCGNKATDEEIIRATVNGAVLSAEAKDIAGFMKVVAKDYRDDNGLDYNGVKGIVFREFFKPGRIKIFVTGITVEVKGEKGLVTAKAVLVRGAEVKTIKDVFPENADAFKFTLIFKKQGAQWKLFNATWEPVSVAGLL